MPRNNLNTIKKEVYTMNEHKETTIVIEKEALKQLPFLVETCWPNVERILAIIDETVWALYKEPLTALFNNIEDTNRHVTPYVIPAGEASKSMTCAMEMYQTLVEGNWTRGDAVLAIGGGVIGDVSGFVAATYMRGIHFAIIPTTLLAQVDSSIGGKNAINVAEAKNNIGTFYLPDFVLTDPCFLKTLDDDILYSGYVELLKIAAIADKPLWDDITQNEADFLSHLRRAIEAKMAIVEGDQFDRNKRMLLNFGHTLGHAIETLTHYNEYAHGIAVGIGMVEMLKLATHAGWCDATQVIPVIEAKLKERHLPTTMPRHWSSAELMQAMMHDKKASGHTLTLILLEEIGQGFAYHVSFDEFEAALASYLGERTCES